MKKIVIKKNPMKKTFVENLEILFHKIFRERTFVANKNGTFVYYKISSFFQSVCVLSIIALLCWTVFTTKMYMTNTKILDRKNKQVEDARNKFNKLASDINAYKEIILSINEKMENSQKNVFSLLEKNKELSRLEKDNIVKNRLLLSTELKYVNSNLEDFVKSVSWASTDVSAPLYKNTKNELERNVVLNENIYLKKRNGLLEESLSNMKQLQDNLLDKITLLAEDNISEIEKTLSKVDIILSQVNLKNRNALVKKVASETDGLGGKYIPLDSFEIYDEGLSQKFKDANSKIYLWEGLAKAKSMLPLGSPVSKMRITSPFGIRTDPFFKTPAMHSGIDFRGKEGTPLYSTAGGKVIQAGPRGDYGLCVEVDHGLGFSTLYGHLSKITVQKGDEIDEGTKVGLAGSTGRSTGPHLHYELRYNSRVLNPYAFLKVDNKN